jgi:hypothetical protein
MPIFVCQNVVEEQFLILTRKVAEQEYDQDGTAARVQIATGH